MEKKVAREKKSKNNIYKKEIDNNDKIKNVKKQTNSNNTFILLLKEYYKFYKENLKKKHIVIFVICLCIFFIVFSAYMSKISATPNITDLIKNSEEANISSNNVFTTIFSQNIPAVFVTILAGIVPYVYIPVLGVAYAYTYAVNIVENFATFSHVGNVVCMTIGAIINLFSISFAIATGICYCKFSTKRQKYNKTDAYTLNSIKKKFYEDTKNKEKLKQLENKIKNKEVERQKYNVKVPYINILISFIISSIIIIIGTLISAI